MRANFVARGVHNPTRFNTSAEVRARMFRAQRNWLAIRRIPGIIAGDLNAKRPWKTGKRVQHLASHSVDNIYGTGTDDWQVLDSEVIPLRSRGLSDHEAVRVTLRHKPTGEILVVATVNLKRHWKNPGYRALKIMSLLDADVAICNEANDQQASALRGQRGLRVYQARSSILRGRMSPKWTGNLICYRTDRVMATRRRNRPVSYIYLIGKKKRRRPRIPVPAVNFSPIVWLAFVPNKKESR